MNHEINTLKESLAKENELTRAALSLRSAIKKNGADSEWPHTQSSLAGNNVKVPTMLNQFLVCILCGELNPKSIPNRTKRLIQSFSQDLIYAVSCGKQKPSKHILLAYAVKALSGNVELLQSLKHMGHTVSYSQIEENDTALCLQKLLMDM